MSYTTMHDQCRQALDNPYLPHDIHARCRENLKRPDEAIIRLEDDTELTVGEPAPTDRMMRVTLGGEGFDAYVRLPVADMRRLARWILDHTENDG